MMHLPERMSWVQEARLEGRSEGLRTGLRKGLKQGLDKGRLDMALSVLRRRYGRVTPDHLRRLREADQEKLATWIERAFSCKTLDDVFQSRE